MNMKNVLSFVTFILLSNSFQSAHAEAPAGQRFKKVIWVVFENTDYKSALKQPDFFKTTTQGALLTQVTAEAHPSQGNYIAMIAGDTLGVHNDNNIDLTENHVGDLLEKADLDWKVYAEDYPGNCFKGATSGLYARKHVPFLSFLNVTSDSKRCGKVVAGNLFDQDFKSGNLPAFSMYIPNLKNDGHNTGVDYAGKWMTAKFGSIFSNPALLEETLFILTFDESGSRFSNQIFTVLLGGSVVGGTKNSQALSHEALLKMVEDEFNLGNLGRNDQTALEVSGVWK